MSLELRGPQGTGCNPTPWPCGPEPARAWHSPQPRWSVHKWGSDVKCYLDEKPGLLLNGQRERSFLLLEAESVGVRSGTTAVTL